MPIPKILDKISTFKKSYGELRQTSFSESDCNFENMYNYVLMPSEELLRIYIMCQPGALADFTSRIPSFLNLNLTLPELFKYFKKLPVGLIRKIVYDLDGNMGDKESLCESITSDNFLEFKNLAKQSSLDFNSFEKVLLNLYDTGYDLSFENEEDIDNKMAERLEEHFGDSDDESLMYEAGKEFFSNVIQHNFANLSDRLPDVLRHFLEKMCDDALESFPEKDEMENDFNDWRDKKYGYLLYVTKLCATYFGDFNYRPIEKLFTIISWHPCVIKYRLSWSTILYEIPFDFRKLKSNFFENEVSTNPDEFFFNVNPEFVKAGVDTLARFMELCPLTDYHKHYFTFVYRITGRLRPEREKLSSDILLEDSAPYIYYFIKGITSKHPECPEDIYGKMKKFFSTTEFPEDEKDIPEPCDAWKEALAELYPTIFGNTVERVDTALEGAKKEQKSTQTTGALTPAPSEGDVLDGNQFKLPDNFPDLRISPNKDEFFLDAKLYVTYDNVKTFESLINFIAADGHIENSITVKRALVYRLTGKWKPESNTIPKIFWYDSNGLGLTITYLISYGYKKDKVKFKKMKEFFEGPTWIKGDISKRARDASISFRRELNNLFPDIFPLKNTETPKSKLKH